MTTIYKSLLENKNFESMLQLIQNNCQTQEVLGLFQKIIMIVDKKNESLFGKGCELNILPNPGAWVPDDFPKDPKPGEGDPMLVYEIKVKGIERIDGAIVLYFSKDGNSILDCEFWSEDERQNYLQDNIEQIRK